MNRFIRGKRGITADTALRQVRLFRMSPEYWIALQADWVAGASDVHLLHICLAPSYTGEVNASRMAKALGRRGGLARARRLSTERRAEIASLGGRARARSLEAARRIAENFRYAAAVQELRGGAPIVGRGATVSGRLPGIYPASRSTAIRDDGLPRRCR